MNSHISLPTLVTHSSICSWRNFPHPHDIKARKIALAQIRNTHLTFSTRSAGIFSRSTFAESYWKEKKMHIYIFVIIINQPLFGCWRYSIFLISDFRICCVWLSHIFDVVSALLAIIARNVSVGVLAHYHPPEAVVVLLLLLFPFNKNRWLCSMIGWNLFHEWFCHEAVYTGCVGKILSQYISM